MADEKHKPELHELLAVEGDLQGTFRERVAETTQTFNKRTEHFRGHHKTLKMKDEGRSFEEPAAEDHQKLESTVDEKLDYTKKDVIRYFDAFLQKERTNQDACADLEVDGEVIAKAIPATALLGFENKLKDVRSYYQAIPTLPPGTHWEIDETERPGVFKAREPEVREKTEKDIEHKVVVKPTDHHPAQIAERSITKTVGVFTTERWCGMITPGRKSELLGRLDKLIRACKQARQRANSTQVVKRTIGEEMFNYIHGE